MILYFKDTCPFCRRVTAVIDRMELEVEMKDVTESDDIRNELIERGGKPQVPYLIDEEKGFEGYESDDIVAHLQTAYGDGEPKQAERVAGGDAGCTACEA